MVATPLALFGAAPAEGGEGLNGDVLKKHGDAAHEKNGDAKRNAHTDVVVVVVVVVGGAPEESTAAKKLIVIEFDKYLSKMTTTIAGVIGFMAVFLFGMIYCLYQTDKKG